MVNLLDMLASSAEALEGAGTMAELEAQLALIQQELGFSGHYLSFQPAGSANRVPLTDLVDPADFPAAAIEAVAARRVRPFFWDRSSNRPQTRRTGSSIFVAPLHIPEIATGFACWFSGGNVFQRPSLAAGQYLAACVFEQLHRLSNELPPAPRRLSKRQRDCLLLAARGKSDWVASQILGLQPDTVHKYIEQAKTRYNVSTRTELVVRALYSGELHFHELID